MWPFRRLSSAIEMLAYEVGRLRVDLKSYTYDDFNDRLTVLTAKLNQSSSMLERAVKAAERK